ncbi:MAG: hypothetical protein Q8K85_19505, partial [Hyphomicrobium sp.]|nr:hypothetical protein [Hyphomicrobium sp.]
MRELQMTGGAVTDRMNAFVRRLQFFVDDDAGTLIANTGGIEAKAIDGRLAAGGDQQMRAFDFLLRFFLALRAFNRQRDFAFVMRDRDHLDGAAQHNAVARELVEHDRGAFGIVLGERRRRLTHGDRAAEAAKRLRHFQTDRSTADDQQMLRPLRQIENGLIGEIRPLVETIDRRRRRHRSGRDHEPPGADFNLVANRDGAA